MEKIKVQVYLPPELHTKLLAEAATNGISAPAFIVDMLTKRYFAEKQERSEVDITASVINEFKNFSPQSASGEFTIHEASPTFVKYPQYRALLGKKIALLVAEGGLDGISVVRTRSGSVKRRRDGAAVYIRNKPED